MNRLIDRNRLGRILEAYGGDPRRWPEEEREAALALLESLPDADRLRSEARGLDLLLDEAPALEPSPALRAAILAGRPRPQAKRFLPWREWVTDLFGEVALSLPARRMAATVLAASFLCGAALGAFGFNSATATTGGYWPGAYVSSIYQGY